MMTQMTAIDFDRYQAINQMFNEIADAREDGTITKRGELLHATFYAKGWDRWFNADVMDVTPQEGALEAAYRVMPQLIAIDLECGDILVGNIDSAVWFLLTTDGDIWPTDFVGNVLI